MRVKCLAQEHNTMSPVRAEPRLLAPEATAPCTLCMEGRAMYENME